MDNLTHSLTGLLLARAGLNRLVPRATALVIVAANLPDLDIVTGLRGSLCYLANHRGFSHALFWLPLVALAPLPIWWLLARRQGVRPIDWLKAYGVSVIALLSHLVLDWMNIYGIRLKLPFSGEWLHLDLLNIVDAWVLAVLLLCALGPMLGRLVESEMGARRGGGRGMAIAGLLLVTAYIGGRAVLHDQAVRSLEARMYQKEMPRRVLAVPGAFNPWQWTGVVETADAWHLVPLDLHRELDPDAGRIFPKTDVTAVRTAVLATETARVFLDFSQAPLWRITPAPSPEGAVNVAIHDLRFGPPGEGAFSAEWTIDARGRVVQEGFGFGSMVKGKKP
ncbi:metal-dependent hydrolase [uncultured Paludibaculum sp.]|uniref:metal-dependent hydrolase n=1 Tax=uncultured Paludibaculum sp. TaxID=1765020 RepID=UPI002AAB1ACF|nr:metal-dependent hydrolase [uncultured Paludibaculum sp.]